MRRNRRGKGREEGDFVDYSFESSIDILCVVDYVVSHYWRGCLKGWLGVELKWS